MQLTGDRFCRYFVCASVWARMEAWKQNIIRNTRQHTKKKCLCLTYTHIYAHTYRHTQKHTSSILTAAHHPIHIYSCQGHHTCVILRIHRSISWQVITHESKDASQWTGQKCSLKTEMRCGVLQHCNDWESVWVCQRLHSNCIAWMRLCPLSESGTW